jgi:hypothetical protein
MIEKADGLKKLDGRYEINSFMALFVYSIEAEPPLLHSQLNWNPLLRSRHFPWRIGENRGRHTSLGPLERYAIKFRAGKSRNQVFHSAKIRQNVDC